MPALFSRLQGSDAKTIAYPVHEPWLDVGSLDDLDQTQQKNTLNIK